MTKLTTEKNRGIGLTRHVSTAAMANNGENKEKSMQLNRFASRTKRLMGLFVALLLPAVIGACADGNGGPTPPATLTSVAVSPGAYTLPITGVLQSSAIATYSDGSSRDVTAASTWAAANVVPGPVAVATVSDSAGTKGIATARVVGQSFITAAFGGLTSPRATLTVNAATSVSFVLTPALASIPVTGTQKYTAIETFSDGSTFDRTIASAWTAPDLSGVNVATVTNQGQATGVTIGTSTITVNSTVNGITKTATGVLTVNAATSKSFVLTPALATVPVTGTQKYTAIETFSDGSTFDRTAASVWTAPDLSGLNVATIDNVGQATGNAIGTSTITAIYTVNGVIKTATGVLTVNAATTKSFAVTPATATVSISGGSQQFVALETFSDGSTFDRSAASIWTAVDLTGGPGVATIGNTGLATGAVVGTTTIRATYTVNGIIKTGSAILTVTAPVLGPAGSTGAVDLKSVNPYGIIAFNSITNSGGPSHVFGDVALTGGVIASCVGFNDAGVAPLLTSSLITNSNGNFPGMITASDNGTAVNIATLPQLQVDLHSVFLNLQGRPAPALLLTSPLVALGQAGGTFPAGTNLSGFVLSPGIYTTGASYALDNTLGALVLDAGGNADALFIIKSTSGGSGFTSTTGSVVLHGGAQAKNVFWVMDNDITIGASTFFQGTVVAGNTITLLSDANVEGRMLAGANGAGSITLTKTNIITVPK